MTERLELYKASNDSIGAPQRFTQKALRDIHTNTDLVFYEEFMDGRLVGMVCLYQDEMKYLAVHPEYRRRGVGSRLMRRIIQEVPTFVFNCNGKNTGALKFYEQFSEIIETRRTTRKIFGHDFTLVYYQKVKGRKRFRA